MFEKICFAWTVSGLASKHSWLGSTLGAELGAGQSLKVK
jgi:hypothetical protein